ncbi:MAG: (d)CMP kinase [Saprospiraceae bacterium]|nr:(d)CMP kinase [Saprospiraceae bacterium]
MTQTFPHSRNFSHLCPTRNFTRRSLGEGGQNSNLSKLKLIIAIDGHSSCGKSTLAKGLAKALHYAYLDTGAMYRAVTLYFLENGVDYNDPVAVDEALEQIDIHFERIDGQNHTFLNGRDVERAIREMQVSEHVSPVSAISAVRRAMVAQQKALGNRRGIVADGRDIGTVVFPDADLKIFLTADVDVRTSRRHLELAAKGIDADWDEIRQNLETRDRIDSSRADSPLRRADDAVVIDNTLLSEEQQLEQALQLVHALEN